VTIAAASSAAASAPRAIARAIDAFVLSVGFLEDRSIVGANRI